jgi:hypothetical protein
MEIGKHTCVKKNAIHPNLEMRLIIEFVKNVMPTVRLALNLLFIAQAARIASFCI